jgi:hypothetical protein
VVGGTALKHSLDSEDRREMQHDMTLAVMFLFRLGTKRSGIEWVTREGDIAPCEGESFAPSIPS